MPNERPAPALISRLDPRFRRDFARMPENIRVRAREAYTRFVTNPGHPGLRFKQLHGDRPLWSVRITGVYRAVGVRTSESEIIWFFIGTHAEYDKLLRTI